MGWTNGTGGKYARHRSTPEMVNSESLGQFRELESYSRRAIPRKKPATMHHIPTFTHIIMPLILPPY